MIDQKKITPSEALKALQQYHESVMALVNACEFVVGRGLISAPAMSDEIQRQINEVKKFYNQ